MNEVINITPISAELNPIGPMTSKKSGFGFSDRLKDALNDVNQAQKNADQSVQQVVEGKKGVHEGMLSLQEADMSLRLMLQYRKKAMEAYKEILRMPV